MPAEAVPLARKGEGGLKLLHCFGVDVAITVPLARKGEGGLKRCRDP